jgi:hypothetical protein
VPLSRPPKRVQIEPFEPATDLRRRFAHRVSTWEWNGLWMDFPGKITYTRGVRSDAGDDGIASCIVDELAARGALG